VLFASLALDLLFWQWRPLGGLVWSIESPAARALVWTVFAYGWLQVLVMTFLINHFDLFGLRQVWLHLIGRHYTRVGFATPAPYRIVRHPLYLGFLLAFWAAPTMTLTHLVFAMVTTVYIFSAIQFEEQDLVAEHGASYQQYRQSVPMLLPIGRSAAKAKRVAAGAGLSAVAALAIAGFGSTRVLAQGDHSHGGQTSDLVKIVRDATERFRDVRVAEREGYQLLFGCVSGPDFGANRFGLPAFYTLHVWAWKENPNGTFVNWHPNVSCDGFAANP
jgi:protein-S-isoprenylcysteine O-methyltransferase Ste14